jgi:hypothetical protein
MTEAGLEKALCSLLSSLGLKAVRTRECKEAPQGCYYSVGVSSVDPVGKLHACMSSTGAYQYSATVVVWEVEGTGEGIRAFAQAVDSAEFRTTAEELGFSIWDIGSIMDMSTLDGAFWIRQKRMEVLCAFSDIVQGNQASILSVEASGEGLEIQTGIT